MIDKEIVLAAVVDGLDKFRNGSTYSRVDVFTNNEALDRQSQRRILDHLVAAKVLAKEEVKSNDAYSTVFKVRNTDELEALLENDEKLHKLIWPHAVYQKPVTREEANEVFRIERPEEPVVKPAPPPVVVAPPPPVPAPTPAPIVVNAAPDPEVRALLERLCLLFDAAMDTIILTRDKTIEAGNRITALEAELKKLRKDLGG